MNRFILSGKVILTGAIALAFAFTSCDKEGGQPSPAESPSSGTLILSLPGAGGTAVTRAVGVTPSSEEAVQRWTAWVFDGKTATSRMLLYGSASGEGARSAAIEKTVPARRPITIAILVNGPTAGEGEVVPASIQTLGDLRSHMSLLEDNAIGSLVMYGEKTLTLDRDETVHPEVDVQRLASKIVLRGLTVAFEKSSLQAKPRTLEDVYLTNVLTRSYLGSAFDASDLGVSGMWYNPMGWHRDGASDVSLDALTGTLGMGQSLTSPYTGELVFYAYPNPESSDTRDTAAWSVRHTRLVLRLMVGDKEMYYQLTVPPMERNKIYTASGLTITQPGTADPEDPTPVVLETVFKITDWLTWDNNYNVTEIS